MNNNQTKEISKASDINTQDIYRTTQEERNNLKIPKSGFMLSGDKYFFTIQGEGKTIGTPCIFIRLHFCNLRCTWCDTWYTWHTSTKEFWSEPSHISYKRLYEELNKFPCKRIVFTGGEPLLQQDRITGFLRMYPEFECEIETNGTIKPNDFLLKNVQFNCSPKLKNSGNPKSLRFKPEILRAINDANCVFKFVARNKEDVLEVRNEFVETGIISSGNVSIMPEGTTIVENQEVLLRIVDVCKENNFRLIPRLQNVIWGAKRRV